MALRTLSDVLNDAGLPIQLLDEIQVFFRSVQVNQLCEALISELDRRDMLEESGQTQVVSRGLALSDSEINKGKKGDRAL